MTNHNATTVLAPHLSRDPSTEGHSRTVKNRQRSTLAALVALLSLATPAIAQAQVPAVAPAEGLEAPDVPTPAPPQIPPQQKVRPRIAIPAPLQAPSAPQAAPQPAQLPPAGSSDPNASPDAKKEPSVEERAARGVVVVERGGQPISLGATLGGDGRILTALSPLGSGNDLDVRFADGTVVRVKLGHHDRTWDLALLVPQSGRWTEGLTASSKDPLRQDATIRSFSMGGKGKPLGAAMVIRGRKNLLGADDTSLPNAFELGSRVSPLDLGAPIVDEDGRVVAMLARGCSPNENRPCTPVAFGVPIASIRSFLRTVPPTAVQPAAWLGIQGVGEIGTFAKGVRVQGIAPESPAAEAKLLGGDPSTSDMILAVDGLPVTTPEALAEAIRTHAVGEKVPLTVFGQGKYRQVTVVLRQAPDPRAQAKAPPAHPAELPQLGDAPRAPLPRSKQDLLSGRR